MRTIYKFNAETGRVEEVMRKEPGEQVHIIGDRIDDRGNYHWHPAFEEDRYFASKSEFRKATKALGYVEKGSGHNFKPERQRANVNAKDVVAKVLNDMKYNPGKYGRS